MFYSVMTPVVGAVSGQIGYRIAAANKTGKKSEKYPFQKEGKALSNVKQERRRELRKREGLRTEETRREGRRKKRAN